MIRTALSERDSALLARIASKLAQHRPHEAQRLAHMLIRPTTPPPLLGPRIAALAMLGIGCAR